MGHAFWKKYSQRVKLGIGQGKVHGDDCSERRRVCGRFMEAMLEGGMATGNDVAVFTAMCMCWSGYLSTHVAMMDGLKFRELTGHAILCHTIGGLFAGISAHFIYILIC